MSSKVPSPLFVSKRRHKLASHGWCGTCLLAPSLEVASKLQCEPWMGPILPRPHVAQVLVGWVRGVATFSSILHPYGCHPLALSTCTWCRHFLLHSSPLQLPPSCSLNLYLVASLFMQWQLVAPPFECSGVYEIWVPNIKFRSGTHWWCLKAPRTLPTYLYLNV